MKKSLFPDANLPYVLFVPDDVLSEKPVPLIVFLHGRGERGKDLDLAQKWGVPQYLNAGNDLPAIVYVPQCPDTVENWVPVLDKVIAGMDAIQDLYSISNTHITGFSMGGHGTHYLAVKHPERFSTVAPVATYMYPTHDVTNDVCILKDKRVWLFHSVADFVPVEHSDNVVETLRACDAENIRYTRYEKPDHTQTAELAYFNEELYEWMLK